MTLHVHGCVFAPVIALPDDYEVYDFTNSYDPDRVLRTPYGIGRYNEKRRGMYTTALFEGVRDIHVGIDIAAPVGEPVHAFFDGEIFAFAYNAAPGDYGYTLVTQHCIHEQTVWALYGHLQARSMEGKSVGQRVARGEVIAWVGDRHENGGYNPHVHFQLSLECPKGADMPGAVSDTDREHALTIYPDPRIVLGSLY
jgi:peptidoglycan LD-endopeptidase LytH